MNRKALLTRCPKFLFAAMAGVAVTWALLPGPSAAGAAPGPQTRPATDEEAIRSIADLDGDWAGKRDGVEVELRINSKAATFRANWTLTYKVRRDPPAPEQSPTVEVREGADLKCSRDPETGRIKLFLPAYLGPDAAMRRCSALTGKSPV